MVTLTDITALRGVKTQLSRADRLELHLMSVQQRREAIAALRHRLVTLADRLRTVPLSRTEQQRLRDRAEAAHSALVVLELVDKGGRS